MEDNQKKQIIDLVTRDKMDCASNIRAIQESQYPESNQNLLTGFFRARLNLNEEILEQLGEYKEKNIGQDINSEKA